MLFWKWLVFLHIFTDSNYFNRYNYYFCVYLETSYINLKQLVALKCFETLIEMNVI